MQVAVRVRYLQLGGHVHARIFVGRVPALKDDRVRYTLGIAGTLVVREDEWPYVQSMFTAGGALVLEEEAT